MLAASSDRGILFHTDPSEWCFSQLRDAALVTLEAQAEAMKFGMSLRDASPFLVQFDGTRAVLTNPLAFERETLGPWRAYDQFCRQFLVPLYLIRYKGQQPAACWDGAGIPLTDASRRLGIRSYFDLDCLLHIHMHVRAQSMLPNGFFLRSGEGWTASTKSDLVASLQVAVTNIKPPRTVSSSSQCPDADAFRKAFVRRAIGSHLPNFIYDLSGADGTYTIPASEHVPCVVVDPSPSVVESIYRDAKTARRDSVLPLIAVADGCAELSRRRKADLVISLDILGKLRYLSLRQIAALLHGLGRACIIEFVHPDCQPPSNSPVGCTLEQLLAAFESQFSLLRIATQPGARRQLLLLKSIGG